MTDPFEARRLMIQPDKREISIVKQCDLLGIMLRLTLFEQHFIT